jgi:hypothetical protein
MCTAGIVVASQLTTYFGLTAKLTRPLVVVLTVAGLAIRVARLRPMVLDA